MSAIRFRDVFRSYTPPWLRDRPSSGRTAGYRFLWSMIAPLDVSMQVLIDGITAAWPGVGTPTALSMIGRSRGLLRGQDETDEQYAIRLRGWLDAWRGAASAEAVARRIHEYLRSHPRVRVITRSGYWVTLEQNGTITRRTAPWNWDGNSHPERAGYWSEIWLIVYPVQWAPSGKVGAPGRKVGRPTGVGHLVSREEFDAVRGLIAEWKAAHTFVRAVIWAPDATMFNPEASSSLPNGTWGAWSYSTTPNGPRVPSGRDPKCRYWEP